ncbi:MAG: class I SAM-dependent methyltransferase, partial [Gammaproteobacteria bacterium]|nr:class I SAM-dependent methyltransferase [Gammaproteobacteria bacterium]
MKKKSDMRFEFGENWEDYIKKNFNEDVLQISKSRILDFLEVENIQNQSFLDIGCGSGLHSLAALEAGASSVHSFDFDVKSIEASVYLKNITNKEKPWSIEQGSILDDKYINKLPLFDIVYSWGVLHHTGDVWKGIKNAASRVKPGGLFYIALYSADVQIDPGVEFWLDVKKKYISSGLIKRRWMELWYIWRFMMDRQLGKYTEVIERAREYKKERGMNLMTDVRDWLG